MHLFTKSKTNLWHLRWLAHRRFEVGLLGILAVLCLPLSGCQSGTAKVEHTTNQTLYFAATSPELEASLFVHNTDWSQLVLHLNPSQDLTLHYDQLALWPQGGVKSAPARRDSVLLPAGQPYTDTLLIQLIHHARYYQEYGWAGPVASAYQLPLSFISGTTAALGHESLTLRSDQPVPESREGIRLFSLQPSPTWLEAQQLHWKKQQERLAAAIEQEAEGHGHEAALTFDPSRAPFVHASLPELTCGGTNFRLTAHEKNDSLIIGFRLVNHSPFTLQVPLRQLLIANQQAPGVQLESTPPEQAPNGAYWVKKGERLIATLRYKLDTDAQAFELDLTPITLSEVMAPAFQAPLSFRQDMIEKP